MALVDPHNPTPEHVGGSVPTVLPVFDCSGVVEGPGETEVEKRIRAVEVINVIALPRVPAWPGRLTVEVLMMEETVDVG